MNKVFEEVIFAGCAVLAIACGAGPAEEYPLAYDAQDEHDVDPAYIEDLTSDDPPPPEMTPEEAERYAEQYAESMVPEILIDERWHKDTEHLGEKFLKPVGYGKKFVAGDGAGNCGSVWSGNCEIPKDKKLRPKFDTATAFTFNDGVTWFSRWQIAMSHACSYLISKGWDCATTTGTSNEKYYSGNCTNCLASNVDSIFSNSPTVTPPGGTTNKYNGCTIKINKANIESAPLYLTAQNNTERTNFVVNIVLHETYHCAGLPHNNSSGSLMYSGGAVGSGWVISHMPPQAAEGTRLNDYQP